MTDSLYDLAALDMDGTLLNSKHEITPFTREALNRADAAGKVIALCTGRCLSELRDHLARVPGIRYAINESGGCLYDVRADQVLRQAAIDDDVVERLFDIAEPRDVLLQGFFGNQSHMQIGDIRQIARYHMAGFESVFEAGTLFTPDLRALWHRSGRPMTKFLFYFPDEAEKARFTEDMGEVDLCVTGCLGIGYEISPKGAGKDDGLRALCAHLGLPVERTMAVGDGNNDIELMRAAGFSVAMGNAVAPVMQLADAVTEDCDHDGAGKAVLRYLLGEM
jgi:Cof subfamily protein (haloacid dehalogenase superfamily)